MKIPVDSFAALCAVDPVKTEAKRRSDLSGIVCPESDVLVKQEFVEECDINVIMARFFKTGQIVHLAKSEPYFGDVSDLLSYQDSLALVARAEDAFNGLPAEIRRSLDNDPTRLHGWLSDEANRPVALKHGLLKSPPKDSVQRVEVINAVVPAIVPPVVKP